MKAPLATIPSGSGSEEGRAASCSVLVRFVGVMKGHSADRGRRESRDEEADDRLPTIHLDSPLEVPDAGVGQNSRSEAEPGRDPGLLERSFDEPFPRQPLPGEISTQADPDDPYGQSASL